VTFLKGEVHASRNLESNELRYAQECQQQTATIIVMIEHDCVPDLGFAWVAHLIAL
jgi:hypothetical protein